MHRRGGGFGLPFYSVSAGLEHCSLLLTNPCFITIYASFCSKAGHPWLILWCSGAPWWAALNCGPPFRQTRFVMFPQPLHRPYFWRHAFHCPRRHRLTPDFFLPLLPQLEGRLHEIPFRSTQFKCNCRKTVQAPMTLQNHLSVHGGRQISVLSTLHMG